MRHGAWARVTALMLLASCGGGGDGGTATQAETAATPGTASPAPAAGGWTLVWADEFSVDGLPDAQRWAYDTDRNALGWYNNELQYYSRDRLENARVEAGQLVITARQERLSAQPDYGGQNYSSARLVTRGKASWTYGRVEVRAKLPCGRGTWPAIWMLGTGGVWPDDGEIDIMEQTGQNKGEVLGTVHTRAYNYFNGSLGVARGGRIGVQDACTAFNDYELTWTPEKLSIGVNGAVYFEFANPGDGDRARWPFDRPQYLILNLAVGGDLGGIVDNGAMPAEMRVEHVRVYQR